jgi:hypothetical protein
VLAAVVSILAKVQHGVVAVRILHPQWGANLGLVGSNVGEFSV